MYLLRLPTSQLINSLNRTIHVSILTMHHPSQQMNELLTYLTNQLSVTNQWTNDLINQPAQQPTRQPTKQPNH